MISEAIGVAGEEAQGVIAEAVASPEEAGADLEEEEVGGVNRFGSASGAERSPMSAGKGHRH
jgi:hypothetical protein